MTPSAFYIGVWTQPDFYFNTTDWSKIPQFQKWATRGVNLYFVDTLKYRHHKGGGFLLPQQQPTDTDVPTGLTLLPQA